MFSVWKLVFSSVTLPVHQAPAALVIAYLRKEIKLNGGVQLNSILMCLHNIKLKVTLQLPQDQILHFKPEMRGFKKFQQISKQYSSLQWID